jgi:hypothetical protein
MGRPYFLGEGLAPKIPVRVVERVSGDDWQQVTEVEWEIPFDVEQGPLARVVWLQGGDVSELVLVCAHCICDGATGVTLIREILLLLDRPEETIGSYPVFQSVKELIPRAVLANRKERLAAYWKSFFVRVFFSLKPIHAKAVNGQDYAIRWRLGAEMSGALIDRCRREEVTVHALLCVVLLDAYRAIRQENARGKVICPVDIRRYVRDIRKDMMFAFAPIVELGVPAGAGAPEDGERAGSPEGGERAGSPEGGERGGGGEGGETTEEAGGTDGRAERERAGFWERCRRLKGDLAEKVATIKAYELLLHGEYYHPVAKKLIRWLCTDAGSHDLTFSNMGRLDIPEEYETFSVAAVYSPTVAFPWRNPTTVVVSSFREQMDFAFVSNTGALRFEEGMAIKERVMQLLEEIMSVAVVKAELK